MSLATLSRRLRRLEQANPPSLAEQQLQRWMTVCRESELDAWLARLEVAAQRGHESEDDRVWESQLIEEFERRLAAGMTMPPSTTLETNK